MAVVVGDVNHAVISSDDQGGSRIELIEKSTNELVNPHEARSPCCRLPSFTMPNVVKRTLVHVRQ